MLVIDNDFQGESISNSFIALGSFDGLHIGHMALMKECISLADKFNGKSMVYTFVNHPLTLINPSIKPKLLLDNASKLDILNGLGIDIACLVYFDKRVMELSPTSFIEELIERYGMRGIVVGFNYRFGYKNSGDVELLKKLSGIYNFHLSIIEPLSVNGELINSSVIRKLIINGDIESANQMLYEPFMVRGKVVPGKRLGRKLGFPTANIKIDEKFIVPKVGVYYTNVIVQNKIYKGITNVGYNPTVEETHEIKVETNILDLDKDIYNEEIKVYFINRLRDEIKFSNLDELINQMYIDKKNVTNKNFLIFNKK